MGLSIDWGSDGLRSFCCMGYHLDLNVWFLTDMSDADNLSCYGMLKLVGLYDFCILMLVAWNLLFGPDSNEERRHEMRAVADSVYDTNHPESVPLFLQSSLGIISELEGGNIVKFDRAEGDLDLQFWNWLKGRKRPPIGRRVSMSCFGGSLRVVINRARFGFRSVREVELGTWDGHVGGQEVRC